MFKRKITVISFVVLLLCIGAAGMIFQNGLASAGSDDSKLTFAVRSDKEVVQAGDTVTLTAYLENYNASYSGKDIGSISVEIPKTAAGKYTTTSKSLIVPNAEWSELDSINMFVYAPDSSDAANLPDAQVQSPLPTLPKAENYDNKDLFSITIKIDDAVPVGETIEVLFNEVIIGDEDDDFIKPYQYTAITDCYNYTCKIPTQLIKVSGLTLDQTALTGLVKGDTVKLTATILPEDATNPEVDWTTENANVAIVNTSGKITAMGEGTTTIIATAKDGSGKSASCTVTVGSGNHVKGDIIPDGTINSSDALQALRHSVREIQLTGDEFIRGDVVKNDVINSTDALQILRYSVKEITEFD